MTMNIRIRLIRLKLKIHIVNTVTEVELVRATC